MMIASAPEVVEFDPREADAIFVTQSGEAMYLTSANGYTHLVNDIGEVIATKVERIS